MAINKYNAEIMFADTSGVKAKTVLKAIPIASAPDLSKILTLVTAMKALSNAGIFAYSLLGWESAAFAGTVTPVGLNSVKALINLQYMTSGVTYYRNLFIPNPGQDILEQVPGQGVRVTAAALTAITVALTASAGFAVTAVEGKIVVQNRKNNVSPHGSCIGYEDENKNTCYMTIPAGLVTAATALVTLATALQTATVSASKTTKTAFLTKSEALPDPTEGIGLPAVDEDNILFGAVEARMRTSHSYVVSSNRKYEHVILPAPKYSECVLSGKNYKFTVVAGEALAAALTTFYGSGNRALTYAGSKMKNPNLAEQL